MQSDPKIVASPDPSGVAEEGKPHEMTPRERIMAALRRQPVDKIPFVPLIDTYTIMDLLPDITDGAEPGYDATGLEALMTAGRKLRCDLMLRHVTVTTRDDVGAANIRAMGDFESPVDVRGGREGDVIVEEMFTPKGNLTATWGFTDHVGWIPHPVKHLVNSYEELKIFHYAVNHLNMDPPKTDYSLFWEMDESLGDDGSATVSLPNSPLMSLIELLWGLENTHYLLHDYREEVEDIMAKLHAVNLVLAKTLAACPAEVIISYENTSSTLHSADQFRHYIMPYLNEYADVAHEAGKVFLIHQCGKLRAFVDDMATAHFDGNIDISPGPTGDLPLDEAAALMPDKVVAGGVDPTTFISRDTMAVRDEISGLIERIKPYPGVLLGSADTTPWGALPENFHLMRELIDTAGSYI
jgi:hypothetical protein